jgi:hypothetical protein
MPWGPHTVPLPSGHGVEAEHSPHRRVLSLHACPGFTIVPHAAQSSSNVQGFGHLSWHAPLLHVAWGSHAYMFASLQATHLLVAVSQT